MLILIPHVLVLVCPIFVSLFSSILLLLFLFSSTMFFVFFFFFSSRRRHTRSTRDWSSDVCSSDLSRTTRRRPDRQALEPLDQRVVLLELGGHRCALHGSALLEDLGDPRGQGSDGVRGVSLHLYPLGGQTVRPQRLEVAGGLSGDQPAERVPGSGDVGVARGRADQLEEPAGRGTALVQLP